ncbi:hypothetical protein BC827DRAFT_1250248 [Russula dissimulans]|nr:hypothetical protein BC827DRAFT_1250248 [Russula dissimulans]
MAAQDIDTYGVRTFSAKEMAFNILELMQPILFSITQVKPTWAASMYINKELDFAAPLLVTMSQSSRSSVAPRPSATRPV